MSSMLLTRREAEDLFVASLVECRSSLQEG